MSLSAANAAKFWQQAVETGVVWGIRDAGGFPTSKDSMPFWSSEMRAKRIIETVAAYSDFTPEAIPLADFLQAWLPGLESDGLKVGINWYGKRVTGYNYAPSDVAANIAATRRP